MHSLEPACAYCNPRSQMMPGHHMFIRTFSGGGKHVPLVFFFLHFRVAQLGPEAITRYMCMQYSNAKLTNSARGQRYTGTL